MNENGFTLLELLIVVAIIGILAAIAIPGLITAKENATRKATMADLRNYGTALNAYYVSYDQYPDTSDIDVVYDSLVPLQVTTIRKKDSWGNPFHYSTDVGTHYTVESYGKDNVDGLDWDPNDPRDKYADFNLDIIYTDGNFHHP